MNKIIVIAPYRVTILKAIINTIITKLAEIIIIGNRKKIIELCYINNINYRLFTIINSENEIEITNKVKEIITKDNIQGLIFGDVSLAVKKHLSDASYEINIIDVPTLKHLLFVSQSLKTNYCGYDEKIKIINTSKDLMARLGINNYSIGLVDTASDRLLKIERNVLALNSNDDLEVIDSEDIFDDLHNILVFNDNYSTKLFLDAIDSNDKIKYASIKKASNHFVIDACNMKLNNLFFSIFLLNKIRLNTEAS